MLQKLAIKRFLETFRHISHGQIHIELPDGKTYSFVGRQEGAHAALKLHDWRTVHAIAQRGDIGLAESYREGWWDAADLVQLFMFALQNEAALDKYIYGSAWARITARMAYLFTRNTVRGSRKNIHAHYDLGNEFYSLWLDPSMTYSSAIFANDSEDLTTAQQRKYDRIIDRLGGSGRLLEIGCGWGGFIERALQKHDYAIKALTLSEAQAAYARQRAEGRADISLEDYRTQKSSYDYIVSIEMFEAVGERYWPVYFKQIKSLLAQKGRALVQTITIGNDYFDRYRASGDVLRSHIFPGGMLPSPQRFRDESHKAGLAITDSFAFGQDYARTLEHWLERFESKIDEVKKLGFDEPFIRMWRFYLTCCIASFTTGRTNVMQLELQHAR